MFFFFLVFGAMKSFIKLHFLICIIILYWSIEVCCCCCCSLLWTLGTLQNFEFNGILLSVHQNRAKSSPLVGYFFFVWLGKRICVSDIWFSLSGNTVNFSLYYPTAPKIPLSFSLQLFLDCPSSLQRLAMVLWYEYSFLGLEVFCFLFLNLLLKCCRYFSSNNAQGIFFFFWYSSLLLS